jgi:2-dehydro-3-deoxygluconokinase
VSGALALRPASECRFEVVTLGEVMLRFDPGEHRVRTARTFAVSEGGGEYNVGRALRRVFGHRVATVTAIGLNEVGLLLEDLLLQGGTNLDHVVWKPADPIGRAHRNALNFTERGFGVRRPVGVSDRAYSATASLEPHEVDWHHLFGELGVRWFHTGGIFTALSPSTLRTARAAIAAARAHGTVVSYDVNYRPSLWRDAGGRDAHDEITANFSADVDVLFGIDPETFEETTRGLDGPSVVATTQRNVRSASRHDWSGIAWSRADGIVRGPVYDGLAILDRVGGGDGFASGVVHGLLTGRPVADAVALGVAHGALVMSTPGDTSPFDAAEVERLADGLGPPLVR